jgi:hypothetical protein
VEKEEMMALEEVALTIRGESGAEVKVVPRDRGDEPPEPVFNGNFDQEGSVKLSLPRAYYVVLSPGFRTEPVDLGTGPSVQTVQLRKVES